MEINRKDLIASLEAVQPGLAGKEVIEQSTSFCFVNNRVVTYNDEISVSCPIEFVLEGAVNSQEFYNILKKIKKDTVELEQSENSIQIKSGRTKAEFTLKKVTLPVEEIGKIKKWKELPEDFVAAVGFVMGAAGNDASRQILTCVNIDNTIVEASDSYRAARYEMSNPLPIEPYLLPARIYSILVNKMPTHIAAGEGWVHFKLPNDAVMSCRIFNGKYVNIGQYMEDEGGEKIVFPKQILDILERAQVFAKRNIVIDERIDVELSGKKLNIYAKSDSGSIKESARATFKGDSVKFAITPYLFKDILMQTHIAKLGEGKLVFTGDNWKYLTLLRD